MFCRHGRREENCVVCANERRRKARRDGAAKGGIVSARSPGNARSASRSAASSVRRAKTSAARRPAGGGVRVTRATRHADDGWSHELLPGLHSSREATDLLGALARAEARLERLAADPPGPYATARALAGGSARDRSEAAWLLFQIAYYGPVEGDAPFASMTPALVRGDEPLPDAATLTAVTVGPRGAHAADRGDATLRAYREWAARAEDPLAALTAAAPDPARRFDAAFRALALPGLTRPARYELIVTLGRFGLVDAEPWSLLLDAGRDGRDPLLVAVKRAFLSDDAVLLQRRLGAFARELGVSIAACDLGFRNWELRPGPGVPLGRLDAGVPSEPDPARIAGFAAALGLDAEPV